ncbi:hypothetical protein M433DRAFT_503673 [Acidomyces richmondensis BFW]|nr:MAG: hypothetical protein FE78DRAFT_309510 [Acidomyces sp. 'richmondensis']KYG47307.1 hypothetical protein M433DRAFT_503673 [Acidomyces richmondensis BFW]
MRPSSFLLPTFRTDEAPCVNTSATLSSCMSPCNNCLVASGGEPASSECLRHQDTTPTDSDTSGIPALEQRSELPLHRHHTARSRRTRLHGGQAAIGSAPCASRRTSAAWPSSRLRRQGERRSNPGAIPVQSWCSPAGMRNCLSP